MNKNLLLIILVSSLMICGCGTSSKGGETPAADPAQSENSVSDTVTTPTPEIAVEKVIADTKTSPAEEPEDTAEGDIATDEPASDEPDDTTDKEVEIVNVESEEALAGAQPVVWLGDSLTQGSLGDDGDNLPNAPYEKLKTMVKTPVEGYGLYGFNTHDILWVYLEESWFGQTRDPNKTYIFWVGSNDWVVNGVPNTVTDNVISEIDSFLTRNGVVISNYIVIGTTARYELGDSYKIINAALKDHYKQHYMDVIDVIGPNGYGPDKIHLTQSSYDAVAKAVYKKLKALKYI